jgi:6-phosphogluconolactonase
MFKSTRAIAALLPITALAAGIAKADTFAYVGNADSNDISVFRLEPNTGEMTLLETAPFVGVEKPGSSTPLAVSPDHRFLFAGVRSQPYVAQSFAIDPKTGRLKNLGSGPLADSMANIATDRSGKFLFSASYGGNKVAVNPIGADGVVQSPVQVIPTGLNAHAIQADPNNRFVFATNLGSDQVLAFKFDAKSGQLAANDPPAIKVADKSGPRHFVFLPNHKFIYLVHELDGAILVFAYDDGNGSWHELQRTTALPAGPDGKPFEGKPWAADIHVTPNGRFLYASERTSSTLTTFKIDAKTGLLTLVGSVPTEKQPRGFNIDPTGRTLAAVGELSDSMTVYSIDPANGALAKLKSYPVGKKPNWVEFVAFP